MAKDGHGRFHWNELLTNDVEGAKAFYGELMGWNYDAMNMPEGTVYHVATKGGEPVAGIMKMPDTVPTGTPPHWMSYVEVDDIDARLKTAKAAGATVLMEPFEVEGTGRIAMLQDPTGAVIGWITPDVAG